MQQTEKHIENDTLTEQIIGAAIQVHRELGPGLLESAYEACLCHELSLNKLKVERQKTIPISYKGIKLDALPPDIFATETNRSLGFSLGSFLQVLTCTALELSRRYHNSRP